MKKILGLDLGTNSIGWALIEQDFTNKQGKILGMGSRIIPMSQDILGEFGKGNSISQTAERTGYRGVRRLRERHLLRRDRIHRVLYLLGFLPKHYAAQIDFKDRLGQFLNASEPKLAYRNNDFIFKKSFEEMVADFRKYQPKLVNRKNRNGEETKVPYDWTIYYLRKKALTQKIEKEELAWIILNFNQKRGYYQLRGEEEEETPNKLVEFYSLKVVEVKADELANKKGETWYSLILENRWIYRRSSKTDLTDWIGKTRDFIVTTDLNDDGSVKTDKDGIEIRSFRAPKEDDWTLVKKKTEQEIKLSDKTVGTFIYETLLHNPNQKIKGKLIRTIERKFYKEELRLILEKQVGLLPELFTDDLLMDCIRELYRKNEAQQITLSKRDFVHLFLNDIIFYQRPLKSQKSSIGNCNLEFRPTKDEKGNLIKDKDGNSVLIPSKATSKSNPYYQEFRVWQWLYNLKIHQIEDGEEVTARFINGAQDLENLFEFLMKQKEVDHKVILKYLIGLHDFKGKALNAEIAKYRWNYVYDAQKDESKKYPMNETGYEIRRRLEKVENVPADFLQLNAIQKDSKKTLEISREYQLWHLIYSVTDKIEYEKALTSFANSYNLEKDSFVENFKKFKPFDSDYGSFSEKAIKRLLTLMRIGKYWNWEAIDKKTKERIVKILSGEYDKQIRDRVREKAILLTEESHFQGLQLWLAQYIIYDRHSEAGSAGKWNSVADLDAYLKEFKQHSLRNPIVEQVITETLRVVIAIWQQYGQGAKDYFNEIHIELGRDMKNPADERKRLTNTITENENTNLRIKAFLAELLNDKSVENVRPYSPMQQEALKIYEDGILNSGLEIPDFVTDTIKKFNESDPKKRPSSAEINRYKLWLEQKYKSPYTGQIIPLNKLFTTEFEIEHIIPQSRYFDDSFGNKVICEAAVNKLKDNQLGLAFIKNHHGEKVECGRGKIVEILNESDYKDFVKQHYVKNRSKQNRLLLEEIPDKMIERQLNDTRYISKFVSNLLSNIVRAEKDDDGINSINVLPGNGKITTELKQDWGLNDVWNDLVMPRFERLNQLTKTNDFTTWNEKHQKYIPVVPFNLSKGFQKKRIDHRHHAMDALVIACATRDHVQYLNNENAKSQKFHLQRGLARKLKKFEMKEFSKMKKNESDVWVGGDEKTKKEVPVDFLKPWDSFTVDAKNELEKIVVSFKQNHRVINKATNKYEKWVDKNGEFKKEPVVQKGINWAIRKPMHKETVSGLVHLPRIKVPKGKQLTATRKTLDSSFDLKAIESITDTGIQKILRNYLESKQGNAEIAFSPEGIEDMNNTISQYNDGKPHQPILKVRVFELGTKFQVGHKGNKPLKYVEAAKGTNLFFAIYWDEENKKRTYETIPLNIVIERQKQGLASVPDTNDKGDKLLFYLSPYDLVYVPREEELDESKPILFNDLLESQKQRIYLFTDGSGTTANFIPATSAAIIFNISKSDQAKKGIIYSIQNEYGVGSPQSKNQNSLDGIMIKERCWKLKVDRLGKVRGILR